MRPRSFGRIMAGLMVMMSPSKLFVFLHFRASLSLFALWSLTVLLNDRI
jgi:hypothetical protein